MSQILNYLPLLSFDQILTLVSHYLNVNLSSLSQKSL